MRKRVALVLAVVVSLPCIAAATHRVPGTWQVTTSIHFTKGGMQIPPAVRQQMEARGIRVPDLSAPHTFKHCLTPEEAARDERPRFNEGKFCTTTSSKWSGDHFHAEFTCSASNKPSHGVVDGTVTAGGKAYTGTFRMEGDNPEFGGHYVMEGQSSGKWLGPTCAS